MTRTRTFTYRTTKHDEIVDITGDVKRFLAESKVANGLCVVYTPHATAAIVINENDDPNIGVDFLRALESLVPQRNNWLHDRIDGNAASHVKSALLGPSESIPIENARLCLGTWQNIFLVELDGPRTERRVIITILD